MQRALTSVARHRLRSLRRLPASVILLGLLAAGIAGAARSEPIALTERELDTVTAGSALATLTPSGGIQFLVDPGDGLDWSVSNSAGTTSATVTTADTTHAFSTSSSSSSSGGVLLSSTSLGYAKSSGGTATASSTASAGPGFADSSASAQASGGDDNTAYSATVSRAQSGTDQGTSLSSSVASSPAGGSADASSSGRATTGDVTLTVWPGTTAGVFAIDGAEGYTMASGSGQQVQLLSSVATVGGAAFAAVNPPGTTP